MKFKELCPCGLRVGAYYRGKLLCKVCYRIKNRERKLAEAIKKRRAKK